MTKVVRFYIKFEDGIEFSSKNFNVNYNDAEQLLIVLQDIYSIVSPYKAVADIYINEPIYDINGDLQEEIPLASYFELSKSSHVIRYEISSMKLETTNFFDIVCACLEEPALVKQSGLLRVEQFGNGVEVGDSADIDIHGGTYVGTWIKIKYNNLTIDYAIQDIIDLDNSLDNSLF